MSTHVRVAALLAGVIALAGCSKGNDARAEDVASSAVDIGPEHIAIARESEIRTGPTISGSLTALREATVRAEVAGPVVQTYVDQGQTVSAGTLLARLDDAGIRDQVLSAQSMLRSAENAATVARREAERAERLVEAGAIAERDVEAARQMRISASAQLEDARARFALAQRQLEKTQIRAPIAGIVSERAVSAGDVVQPGGALFSVVDPSSMRLEASVPAEALASLRVGAPVEFEVTGYPGRSFTGRVERINPVADPATRQVRIQVTLPNTGGRLVSGLFAEGQVASEARVGVVVPIAAVDVRGVQPTVVRVRDGKVQQVTVQLGLKDEKSETVEIISGLRAGDTLLVGNAQGLSPNTVVKVKAVADK